MKKITGLSQINRIEWSTIIIIACFILLSFALLISHNNPATGYEINIYSSNPNIVWVFICIAFACGIAVVFYQVVTKGYATNNVWIMGLLLLIIARIVLLYIPYIRGYVTWWADNISYLGMVKDILLTGNIGQSNFYPVTHIILSEVTLITGIKVEIVAMLSTAFVSIFFVASSYLLSRVMFVNKGNRILATAIACGVFLTGIYNFFIAPNGWAILFLPFLFYLYFRLSSRSYRILLIIVLLIFPIFHPLPCLMVIGALLILTICRWFFSNLFSTANQTSLKIYSLTFLSVETILLVLWINANAKLNQGFQIMWQIIITGISSQKLSQLEASLNKINLHGIDFLLLLFRMYGAEIILTLISVIGIFILLKWTRNKNRHLEIQNILPLSFLFLFYAALYFAYLLGLPGTQVGAGQNDNRFLAGFSILAPIIAGFTLYHISTVKHFNKIVMTLILLLLICSSTLSIFSIYPSPIVKQPNLQVTQMDMTGYKWFTEKKDIGIGSVIIANPPARFSHAILGYDTTKLQRSDLFYNYEFLSDHFGYSEQDSIGAQYSMDKYLPMTEFDQIVYTTVWKDVGRYNDIDFEKLERDYTVSKLYTCEEMQIYYVKSTIYP